MQSYTCPMPHKWEEIYDRLSKYRNSLPNREKLPEIPVALSGIYWVGSSDCVKKANWRKTLAWARKFGAEKIVRQLKLGDLYGVPSRSRVRSGLN